MPRQEYHPVQGAYVDKRAPADPFIESLHAQVRAQSEHRAAEPGDIRDPEPEDIIACALADEQAPQGEHGEVDDLVMSDARAILNALDAAGFVVVAKELMARAPERNG